MLNELSLTQAYAGAMPAATIDGEERGKSEYPNSPEAYDKFHNSKSFNKKALAAFKEIPYNVWILPLIMNWHDKGRGATKLNYNRFGIYDADEGVALLKQIGAKADFNDIESKLNSGATIIVNSSPELIPETLPTPWMMIHAIYDGIERNGAAFDEQVEFVRGAIRKMMFKYDESLLSDCMTMRSARNKKIETGNDIEAEILTQATITSGVKFNVTDEAIEKYMARTTKLKKEREEYNKSTKIKLPPLNYSTEQDAIAGGFEALQNQINTSGLKQMFSQAMGSARGKIAFVHTLGYF